MDKRWCNEKNMDENIKNRKSINNGFIYSIIISFIYLLSGWIIYPISNQAGVFVLCSGIYMLVLSVGLVLKRDMLSVLIYIQSKEK